MSLLKTLCLVIILGMTFSSCTGDSSTTEQPAAVPTTTTHADGSVTLTPLGKMVPIKLPSISKEMMENLWENCTNIDFLFYNYSFSMNQTESASIKNSLTYFSTAVPSELDSGCSPVGRIFFVSNGEGMTECEFYLGNVCNYFIFFKDGKKVAANMMTPKGEEFLKGTIKRVNTGMPQGMPAN